MSDRVKIIGAFSVVLACILMVAKGLLPPSAPKNVPVITYDQLQSAIQNPCIVYFYHSTSDDSTRAFLPAMDNVASHYKDKLQFFRYRLSNPEQKMPQKFGSESTFTIYDGGKEIRNYPNPPRSGKEADNEGVILVLIKDYLLPTRSDSTEPVDATYITADDFQQRVLQSSRPVIVDFTAAYCPPCRTLEPQFKQIAAQDSTAADFYFFDHANPANASIVSQYHVTATPTVILFFNGQPQGKFAGAFDISMLNEGRILKLLQPYL